MIKYIFQIVILAITLSSCTDHEVGGQEYSTTPVIEGYMAAGSNPSIKIYNQIANNSVSYEDDMIDDLVVVLTVNGDSYTLTQDEEGLYQTSEVILSEGDTLTMSFENEGTLVFADTYIPNKPQDFTQSDISIVMPDFSGGIDMGSPPDFPDPIELEWLNDDNDYHVIVIENIESDPELIFDLEEDEDRPRPIFRNEPTTASNYELQSMAFEYLGTHRIILYRILPDYSALYDVNSNSSQNLTSPESDIENGLGIFTGINADTLWVEVSLD